MSIKYELIIYWSDDDESFVVEVPELPGCMADGETYEQAVANAQQVIEEWIETAWAQEIEERVAAFDRGETKTYAAEDVFAEARRPDQSQSRVHDR